MAELDRFVGRYQVNAGVALTVSRSDATLFVMVAGQAPLPIFAESATKFFLKEVNAELEFEVDASGNPVALTLIQAGGRTRAPRAPASP